MLDDISVFLQRCQHVPVPGWSVGLAGGTDGVRRVWSFLVGPRWLDEPARTNSMGRGTRHEVACDSSHPLSVFLLTLTLLTLRLINVSSFSLERRSGDLSDIKPDIVALQQPTRHPLQRQCRSVSSIDTLSPSPCASAQYHTDFHSHRGNSPRPAAIDR